MSPTLFVTGATGFLGRRFLERFSPGDISDLLCLSRASVTEAKTGPLSAKVTIILGDLLDPDGYIPALRETDIVLHMAAVTGKAPREEYAHVNVEGTRRLVEACIRSGVRKFLYVSSIAAKFRDDGDYPYARSKREAESIVAESGLSYAIVRPTIVLGKGSPIWKNLSFLGRWNPVFLPGEGTAQIQPVHVDDLVDTLIDVIRRDRFPGEMWEIGGREHLPIGEFIRRVHRAYHGRDPVTIHVPMSLILAPLRIAEKAGLSVLPFNAGQFASFRYDGIVEENPLFRERLAHLRGVDEIIRELAHDEETDREMTLRRECEVFSRYLLGRSPDGYTINKYVEANRARDLADPAGTDRFGERLLRIASKAPILARLADAFAAVFARRSLLRKKLVLLIAILESSRTASELFGPRDGIGAAGAWLSLFGNGIAFLTSFLASILLFAPLAIISKERASRPPA